MRQRRPYSKCLIPGWVTKSISLSRRNLFPHACWGAARAWLFAAPASLASAQLPEEQHGYSPHLSSCFVFSTSDDSRSSRRAAPSPKQPRCPVIAAPAKDGLSRPRVAPSPGRVLSRAAMGAAGQMGPQHPEYRAGFVHKLTLTGSDGFFETAAAGKAPAGYTCPSPRRWQTGGAVGVPVLRDHGWGDHCLTPPCAGSGSN